MNNAGLNKRNLGSRAGEELKAITKRVGLHINAAAITCFFTPFVTSPFCFRGNKRET
jgi:hypothetical protein